MKKKGKGLSYDQKREKMLSIFHTSRDVFNYEELEKHSIKAGIPYPNVKDILNSLKADSLVETEKIAAGVFYWAFPSKAHQLITQQIDFEQSTIRRLLSEKEQALQQIQTLFDAGRLPDEERLQLEQRRQILAKEVDGLQLEVKDLIRLDPQRVDNLRKQLKQTKNEINSATDDIMQVVKFVKKMQPGVKGEEIQAAYGIPVGLDYLDD